MQCLKCGALMSRSHRRGIERLIFAQAFRCPNCNTRTRRSYIDAGFDEFANCPRCGNGAPDRRSKKDKVDSMLHSPIRMIHWALGGHLYHCVFCRLQFYDVRALKGKAKQTESPQKADAQSPASRAKMAS
jgi:DNA-directed RNA polymerase subunit RPC12/RpoP